MRKGLKINIIIYNIFIMVNYDLSQPEHQNVSGPIQDDEAMRIAIIDGVNQDIGLKILFPDADYYINNTEQNRTDSLDKYNIEVKNDWSKINDKNYDYLFIVIALYDAKPNTNFFKPNIYNILKRELEIIDNNNFKKVFIFDNYDYDYDPNTIIQNSKVNLFFKRNYNKKKLYNENVIPFPFIMFGEKSIIEKLDFSRIDNDQKIDRIFFIGQLFNHVDKELDYIRDRRVIYNDISSFIYNPGHVDYNTFLNLIHSSKFSLDLNGVGDPNKRTFEILSQGSLRISEYNDLLWPFEETFCEETIFSNGQDFFKKINSLRNNTELYNKCLSIQNDIFIKYFNKGWISEYILKYM
jgi:hypothetical protein